MNYLVALIQTEVKPVGVNRGFVRYAEDALEADAFLADVAPAAFTLGRASHVAEGANVGLGEADLVVQDDDGGAVELKRDAGESAGGVGVVVRLETSLISSEVCLQHVVKFDYYVFLTFWMSSSTKWVSSL